jgi:hypothetical protein
MSLHVQKGMETLHTAYLQVWAQTRIEPGQIIVTVADTSEASQTARADNVATAKPFADDYNSAAEGPIGVSDRTIEAHTRGTIILSGIASIKHASQRIVNRLPGQYFTLQDTRICDENVALRDSMPLQPIGTLINPSCQGDLVNETYYPAVTVYLCPWLCAAQLPVSSSTPGIDLKQLLSHKGYAAFEKTLSENINTGGDITPLVQIFQTALLEGLKTGGLQFLVQ